MLEVSELHARYGYSHILHGVSLKVEEGQVTAVLGRNGVGKTTLVHCIVAFVKPTGGSIVLDGQDITGGATHNIMREGIALVPQGRRVFRSLSVAENLAVPFRCSGTAADRSQNWDVEHIYKTFPILEARQDQSAGNLSGGEQQMLAMGRALVSSPSVLLLDEPSEGLAPLIVDQISDVIAELAQQQMAILLVEQNFNMAMGLAHTVHVMSRGSIVHASPPEQLANNEEVKARYLGM